MLLIVSRSLNMIIDLIEEVINIINLIIDLIQSIDLGN